jgi:universal stress protein A
MTQSFRHPDANQDLDPAAGAAFLWVGGTLMGIPIFIGMMTSAPLGRSKSSLVDARVMSEHARAANTVVAPAQEADHMSEYRKILLVVDLSEDSRIVGERAKLVAVCSQAEITLLHVVEFVPVEPMGEALLPAVQVESELLERARSRLAELALQLGLSKSPQLVEMGSIKSEIIRASQRLGSDLIVLGSRERHGLAILLNFTEDTILHAAPCDVLAVRLH